MRFVALSLTQFSSIMQPQMTPWECVTSEARIVMPQMGPIKRVLFPLSFRVDGTTQGVCIDSGYADTGLKLET